MKNKLLSIGDVSKITGVHIKSLRYYDEIGILKPAYVDPDTKYRYYTHKQIGILDAIRACIELDIPLKEFDAFTENEGRIIQYAKLLEHGKLLVKEKIRSMREGLKMIELFQREIERSVEMLNQTDPVIVDVSARQYFVVPYFGEIEEGSYYEAFQAVMVEAAQSGYKLGYELGKLAFHKSNGVEQYNFIEIVSAPKAQDKHIITIPAGHCISKCVPQSRIQHAAAEFPDLFALNFDKIVVEIELFVENYNLEQPVFELSCYLPDDKTI